MAADLGSDLSGVTDLDPTGLVVTGRRLVAEAIARRLTCPRGRLIDDPDYGTDITEFIYDDMSSRDVGRLTAAIRAECRKEERVETVKVIVTPPPGLTGIYTIEIILQDGEGPFDLVLTTSAVAGDISILKVED